MDKLGKLEAQSIFILREAYRNFKNLAMLWSIGKDSTVLLWLAKKAFFGHVPFELIHIDTKYKVPEMIAYRDRIARELKLRLVVGQNKEALQLKQTFPDGNVDRIVCCKNLKAIPLNHTLDGTWERIVYDPKSDSWNVLEKADPYNAVIVGVRSDEEGSRSKERVFSTRDKSHEWDASSQPPELWNLYKTEFAPGTHVRVHPLLEWTELNIWEYIERENIPVIPIYFDQGLGERYRSLGCYPCTNPVASNAKNPREIIDELTSGKFKDIAERSGRAQDKDGGGTLEALRKEGYM
ncbi:sulfate adenylyltransferase subunit CysD [Helicobacter turcicus]|uniref:Sulfate adenylyltransferase subunit 2 n=1 Tax=Helicobacter turcicus TaxID=2867412 RepID=A0ABS7JKR5_9HELI|nr:sulfate adenylyltransferase subunit CysD [Helicobacter turcicus]MBX7489992.1 sulfate adenylyltransferase subunit 2 [Helicobacter turcicus]MBX7544851.1 sulfate adenylyltransferase subunit 2 [Helicobacter turcicus]